MKDTNPIEHEVNKTLDCLDGISKAKPGPFLSTRVIARLKTEEKNIWFSTLAFLSRPAVALVAILVVIFVNAFIFFEFRSESLPPASEEEQQFANEYNLTDNTIYDSTIEPQ